MAPLIYVASIIDIPKNAITEINNIIQHFIWEGKTSKIVQATLIQSIEHGGLKLCHMQIGNYYQNPFTTVTTLILFSLLITGYYVITKFLHFTKIGICCLITMSPLTRNYYTGKPGKTKGLPN